MLSPFPGMDPYLEDPDIWPDFPTSFFVEMKKVLNEILPPGFVARIDRYIWVHEPTAEDRVLLGKPDVYVAEKPDVVKQRGGRALTAPSTVVLPAVKQEGNRFLKIVDPKKHRVVTVVEILSPSNKAPGPKREAYLMKRNEYFANGVNVIEVDFLRSGPRMPWEGQENLEADYYILVCRASDFPRAGIWPLTVRDPLPTIPVPLDSGMEEPWLSLKECFDRAFGGSRHETEINYHSPPAPPLREPEATWARALISEKVKPD